MAYQNSTCKSRFKGIENFLRRVAFNLGNSPSQTEVKIISCIPVDVTDLQKKIVCLEQQLLEANQRSQKYPKTTQTRKSSEHNKPNHAVHLTSISKEHRPFRSSPEHAFANGPLVSSEPLARTSSSVTRPYPHNPPGMQPSFSSNISTLSIVSAPLEDFQDKLPIYRKDKKRKLDTRQAYYAPTSLRNKRSRIANLSNELHNFDVINHRLLRKVYRSCKVHRQELSDSSQLTAPMCSDELPITSVLRALDSDMCPCCRGRFHNIDHDMRKRSTDYCVQHSTMTPNIDYGNVFYNSSLYDIVPVKEKPNKVNIIDDKLQKIDQADTLKPHATEYKRPIVNSLALSPPTHPQKKSLVVKKSPKINQNVAIQTLPLYDISKNKNKSRNPKILKLYNTECQTESSDGGRGENKTESMLNEIKDILKSVLTQVKTQHKNNANHKGKRDVIVQNNMQEELLNIVTYDPFAMWVPAAPYLTSKMSPIFAAPSMQNYPAFINSGCQFAYAAPAVSMPTAKPAAIPTNTQPNRERDQHKITDHLIKDIYRSIAVDIDMHNFDRENVKSKRDSQSGEPVISRTEKPTMVAALHKSIPLHFTPAVSTLQTKQVKATGASVRNHSLQQEGNKSFRHHTEPSRKEKHLKKQPASKNLLSKIFSSVFRLSKNDINFSETDLDSDLVQYPNIYKEKIHKRKYVPDHRRFKLVYVKVPNRCEPYMEQECHYHRGFEKRLMYKPRL